MHQIFFLIAVLNYIQKDLLHWNCWRSDAIPNQVNFERSQNLKKKNECESVRIKCDIKERFKKKIGKLKW